MSVHQVKPFARALFEGRARLLHCARIPRPRSGVVTLWSKLMENADVMPVGLGARDSLRLEAGLCLYGNDLDTTTSPSEGTLLWVVAK